MNTRSDLYKKNLVAAKKVWGSRLTNTCISHLRRLSEELCTEVLAGDLLLLDGRWYITNAGLLRLAQRKGCFGINIEAVHCLCNTNTDRYTFKATVFRSKNCCGFVGYGDADPSNVSPVVRGAEMRVAETRAVNRALRKAYGIGLCSVEELGWTPKPAAPAPSSRVDHPPPASNGRSNGLPRLRDRFCLLIRQHQLDAGLVKAYAADFCGTASVRDASREQIAEFINHLAERAAKDREGLLCQLNSYRKPQEVTR